jgi:uncharacterized protein YacL
MAGSNISPDALVIIGAVIAILTTQNLSTDEVNVLGNLFAQIGASMLTKAAQQSAIQSKDELKNQISDMEEQLKKLKKQLC